MKNDTISYVYNIDYVKMVAEDENLSVLMSDEECILVLRQVEKHCSFPTYEGFCYAIETVIKDRLK